jgi:type I restriction enzyme S subunit
MSESDLETKQEYKQVQLGPRKVKIPKEWSKEQLGKLGKYQNGYGFEPSDWGDQGRPIIRIQNLTGSAGAETNYYDGEIEDRYVVQNGDLLVSWSATLGVFIWDGPEALLNQHIFKVEPSDAVDNDFLYFLLDHNLDLLETRVQGSTMKHIRKSTFEDTFVPLPPLSEQRRIADVLSTVDEQIQQTDEIIEETKQLKRGIRNDLVLSGISNTKYKQFRVGPFDFSIPDHWIKTTVKECAENRDRERVPVKKKEREEMAGDIPYYGASGQIDSVNDWLFDEELLLLAEDGENLLSREKPVAFKISGKTWVNNHAHVLKPNSDMNIDYLMNYFEILNYDPFATGTAQPKLNQKVLNSIPVPKPPESEQESIAKILETLTEKVEQELTKRSKLKELKHGLMQDLLTGKRRLEAE